MFNLKSIILKEKHLIIRFSSEKQFNTLTAEIRLKDMTRYAVGSFTQYHEVDVTSHSDGYELKVDYSIFTEQFVLKNLSSQVVWIYIYDGEIYRELKLDSTAKNREEFKSPVKFCEIAQIKPAIKGKNTLALTITKCNELIELKNIELNSNHIELTVKEHGHVGINSIYLKKRAFKDTLIYSDSIPLKKYDSNKFLLAYTDLESMHYDSVSIFDFMTELTEKNISIELPIVSEKELKTTHFDLNGTIKPKLYLTAKKSLAIKAEKQMPAVNIQSINENKIEVDLSNIDNNLIHKVKCGLFRVSKVVRDDEMTFYKEIESVIANRTLTMDLNLDKYVAEMDLNQEYLYTIMLYIGNQEADLKYRLSNPNKVEFKLDNPKFNIKCVIENDLRVIIKPIVNAPIKLGILGTCYSRAPFNSANPYFNPDYKTYFSVEYSHFWISLISATSEEIEFDKTLFSDVPEKVLDKITREYEKTTFVELKRADCDYVILDLFVDAVHGCRKLPDGRYLGQNGDMHQSNHYKHRILKETSQFDNRDPEFWTVWQSACEQFIVRLLEVVDQDKIILNWGGLTDTYINDNNQLSSFSKDKKFNMTDIKFINHTWEKMNNYLLAKLPLVKVIDLRKYNYKASLEYPNGGIGPHHYERNYYKSFLGELSKLILRDKVNV